MYIDIDALNLTGIYFIFVISIIFIITLFYNCLACKRNAVYEAFSTMDVYLKKRWDLIPNLVRCAQHYIDYEKSVLKELTRLRIDAYNSLKHNEKINTNLQIQEGIVKFFACCENYPELKSDKIFIDLQNKMTKIEENIAYSRSYYNANVREYNNFVDIFPFNIMAMLFGFKRAKMFSVKSMPNKRNTF